MSKPAHSGEAVKCWKFVVIVLLRFHIARRAVPAACTSTVGARESVNINNAAVVNIGVADPEQVYPRRH